MVRPVDVRPSAGKSEKPDLMWNAGKHNRDSDSTPRPARSKSVKSEKKSRKKNSKRFSGGNFSFFASFLSNSSLKSSRSLPLSAEKRRTLDDGDNVARKDYRRVASWSHYLESYGGQRAVEAAENWMVDMSQLFIGNKFASGTHSRIYRGIYRQKPVAVKMMMQPEGDESVSVLLEKQFTCEVALLSRLRHPNIIEFVAACKKPPVFCIIIEYLSEGSLRTYLHKQEPHSLPLKLVLKIALDVARGMQYLHSQGVIHRDLKSENLLLDDDMHVKVADFGVSCLECQCDHMKGFMGTYRWMAPEMINEKPYTRKVDVYSYGIVLWELLTALIPFQEMTPVQAAFAVSQKNARPPLPTACPLAFRHLIQQCWSTNPDKRPDFNHIVSVLERYDESLKEDPAFFFNYKPTQQHILFRCFKSCVSISSATSVQA